MPELLNLEVTRHGLAVEWAQIRNSTRQEILLCFQQIYQSCGKENKEEFVVQNIAPSFRVGKDDPAIVLRIHDEIVQIFAELVEHLGHRNPESRLNLRQSEFDIRFYVGRERPTDSLYPDDRM